jgi:hypothetical protein
MILLPFFMVEAAGVEPDISVENTQLTDFENARIAENATISKSAVQSLYKHCLKFPELQPSDFPAWCKSTLKRFCSISDAGLCEPQGNSGVGRDQWNGCLQSQFTRSSQCRRDVVNRYPQRQFVTSLSMFSPAEAAFAMLPARLPSRRRASDGRILLLQREPIIDRLSDHLMSANRPNQ